MSTLESRVNASFISWSVEKIIIREIEFDDTTISSLFDYVINYGYLEFIFAFILGPPLFFNLNNFHYKRQNLHLINSYHAFSYRLWCFFSSLLTHRVDKNLCVPETVLWSVLCYTHKILFPCNLLFSLLFYVLAYVAVIKVKLSRPVIHTAADKTFKSCEGNRSVTGLNTELLQASFFAYCRRNGTGQSALLMLTSWGKKVTNQYRFFSHY